MMWYHKNWEKDLWSNQKKESRFEEMFAVNKFPPIGSRVRENLETILPIISANKKLENVILFITKAKIPKIKTKYDDLEFTPILIKYENDKGNYQKLTSLKYVDQNKHVMNEGYYSDPDGGPLAKALKTMVEKEKNRKFG
jgi:hypothetical protein